MFALKLLVLVLLFEGLVAKFLTSLAELPASMAPSLARTVRFIASVRELLGISQVVDLCWPLADCDSPVPTTVLRLVALASRLLSVIIGLAGSLAELPASVAGLVASVK